jgi:hypothetical protein
MSLEQTPSPGILQIDAEIRRRIEAFARTAGVTPSEVVRRAFEEYEATHHGSHLEGEGEETVFDVLSRAGLRGGPRPLRGCAQDTPRRRS